MFELLAQAGLETAGGGWVSPVLAVFLVIAGFILVVAEVLFVSFGLFTIGALAVFVLGIWMGFGVSPAFGIGLLIAAVMGAPLLIVMTIKFMPRTKFGRKLIPENPKLEDVSGTSADAQLKELLGKSGRTMSMCRPSGTAEFDGKRYDVVAEGLSILGDRPVKVVAVEGNRVVVREME